MQHWVRRRQTGLEVCVSGIVGVLPAQCVGNAGRDCRQRNAHYVGYLLKW
jgi:hypothetical protein